MLLMGTVSFFDLEIDPNKNSILDIGCVRWDDSTFHESSVHKFTEFIKDSDFIAGHNVFKHDLKYIHQYLGAATFGSLKTIDDTKKMAIGWILVSTNNSNSIKVEFSAANLKYTYGCYIKKY